MGTWRGLVVVSFVRWLPLAVVTVLLSGVIYGVVQHVERSGANDPLIQLATDAKNALASGASAQSVVPATTIDLAQSLAPYVVVYDASGQTVASAAMLHGQPLMLPAGVLDSAKGMPDGNLITWQPEAGIRQAIVVVPTANGFVIAGRSLKLVEQREDDLLLEVAVGCLGTLAASYLAVVVSQALTRRLFPAWVRAG
jgi:hypothetical protein